MFYSKQTGGFYTEEIHGANIPAEAVEITTAEHAALLDGQSKGKPIKADAQGRPYNEEPPARTLATAKTEKLTTLAAERYKRETAGIDIGTSTIMTDRGSQAMITGAYVAAQINPTRLIDFKGATGWTQINASAVLAISAAVSAHVQACFSTERRHVEAIAAMTTIAAVDSYDITTLW